MMRSWLTRSRQTLPPFPYPTVRKTQDRFDLLGVLLGVEHPVERGVLRVDAAVLRMHVVDAVAQRTHGRRDVDLLPEHVTRIEVAPDRALRDVTQPQHRFGVVDDEVGVHLDGDTDARLLAHAGRLLPVREDALVPLPVEHLQVLGRPRRGDPVRLLRGRIPAWTPAEGDHLLDTEAAREVDGLLEDPVMIRRDLLVGMKRIPVAGEGADEEPAIVDRLLERLDLRVALEQLRRVAMGVARVGSRADLDGREPQLLQVVERLLERLVPEQDREYTDAHHRSSGKGQRPTAKGLWPADRPARMRVDRGTPLTRPFAISL